MGLGALVLHRDRRARLTETGPWKAKFVMVMTTVAEVPAGLPVVDTAAIEEAAGEGSTVCSPAQVG